MTDDLPPLPPCGTHYDGYSLDQLEAYARLALSPEWLAKRGLVLVPRELMPKSRNPLKLTLSEERIEEIAERMEATDPTDPLWKEWTAGIIAALNAEIERRGLVLVPEKPTEEMCGAFDTSDEDHIEPAVCEMIWAGMMLGWFDQNAATKGDADAER